MRSGDGMGRPVLRLLAAVLFVVLGTTGVHGAGSAAVPAGAILTEHASVGAALVQPTPSAGRDEALSIRAADQADQAEELDQPPRTAELPEAPAVPVAALKPALASLVAIADRQQPLVQRKSTQQQGRAPPD